MTGTIEDYKCVSCGGVRVDATIENRFRQLPLCLCVQLNRIEDKKSEVQFPAKLTLTNADNISAVYNLRVVVVVVGEDGKGQYVSYRLHKSRWWKCNDAVVTPCLLETVLAQKAYCLLYEKEVGTNPENAQNTMSGHKRKAETPPLVPRKSSRPSIDLTPKLDQKLKRLYKHDKQLWKHWRPSGSKAKNRYFSELEKFAGYASGMCGEYVTQEFIKKYWWPQAQKFREKVTAKNTKEEAARARDGKLKELSAVQRKGLTIHNHAPVVGQQFAETGKGLTIHNHAPVVGQQFAETSTNTNNIHQVGDYHDGPEKGEGRHHGSVSAAPNRLEDQPSENSHFSTPSRRTVALPQILHPLGSPEAPITLDDD